MPPLPATLTRKADACHVDAPEVTGSTVMAAAGSTAAPAISFAFEAPAAGRYEWFNRSVFIGIVQRRANAAIIRF